MISVIIPAYNEEGYVGRCLEHIVASDVPPSTVPEVIVVANGCRDGTVAEAISREAAFSDKGWRFQVLDLPEGSKTRAINAGCEAARNERLMFVDADVHVSSGLVAGMVHALDRPEAAYASGRPSIRPAATRVSERYARFWEKTPFMSRGVPGCGVYGVNAAGRARWSRVPEVIADDMFIRSHFAPSEMHQVPHGYSWPITEGFENLVRVRRRQNRGMAELSQLLPELLDAAERTSPNALQLAHLVAQDPIGFTIYASVALAVRTPVFQSQTRWDRGRGTPQLDRWEVPGE